MLYSSHGKPVKGQWQPEAAVIKLVLPTDEFLGSAFSCIVCSGAFRMLCLTSMFGSVHAGQFGLRQ